MKNYTGGKDHRSYQHRDCILSIEVTVYFPKCNFSICSYILGNMVVVLVLYNGFFLVSFYPECQVHLSEANEISELSTREQTWIYNFTPRFIPLCTVNVILEELNLL